MGGTVESKFQRFSLGKDMVSNYDAYPRGTHPPTFDLQAGFEAPRKERQMIATWEEMEEVGLDWWERDYCAHHLVAFKKCQQQYAPFASWHCVDARHAVDHCQYEDFVMRMKEFERERRLLLRKQRKDAAQAHQ